MRPLTADKLHRRPTDYPALGPGCPEISLPPWHGSMNRHLSGRMPVGGCLYGGQTATFWAPLRDLLHLTDGPVGCGVYAQDKRPQYPGPTGISGFSGMNLCTDFQERDVVFGGERKLALALEEAHGLFPLHRGATLLATCPVALIGDDLDAVARQGSQGLGQPVVPVHCAGFRRGDGIGDTHATIFGTWRDWAGTPPTRPGPRDVVLLCREMHGAWRGIARLLESVGLRVVSHWPAATDRAGISRLGRGRLVIAIDMEYWARRLEQMFQTPWLEADFLGPRATTASLRAIAAHFDPQVQEQVETLIAREAPAAEARMARLREQTAGALLFSFAPLKPHPIHTDLGLRLGSLPQGWQAEDGQWQRPATCRRYQEMSPDEVSRLLQAARPDVLDGLGQDSSLYQKQAYRVMDETAQAELERGSIGYAGVPRLVREFSRLFRSPMAALHCPPWRQPT